MIFISSIILKFRIYYIKQQEQNQFIILIIIFVISIIILILRNNIFLILLGWDGLGLSSYILVIYYQNYITAASGSITLIRNRIGDILIILSISIILINRNWNFNINNKFNIITLLLLVIARFSKRAQYPFSAWLPIAIAAPTPISALVHSSTLVTAGVFIIIRLINNIHPNSILLIIIVSSITAIYAGISANWELDIKKIIALSTLSQIAIIIFAISIKSTIIAFSHLIIHALFKSTIFLCAGIIIHESSYQDIRKIGTNFITNTPITSSILGITRITLIGIPFSSGFFSKDAILENIIFIKIETILCFIIIISIGLTATYSTRISIISNKFLSKSISNSKNHINNTSLISISIIIILTIISGTSITWIINPQQLIIIPFIFKIKIILLLFSGVILGIILSSNNKKSISLGKSAITLWYNHTTTTKILIPTISLINIYIYNDKKWQEIYGPQKSFNVLINISATLNLLKNIILITILLLIPLIIKYLFSLFRAFYWR